MGLRVEFDLDHPDFVADHNQAASDLLKNVAGAILHGVLIPFDVLGSDGRVAGRVEYIIDHEPSCDMEDGCACGVEEGEQMVIEQGPSPETRLAVTHTVRWVITHIGIHGRRVFTLPRQGRNTHASKEEAERWLAGLLGPEAHNDIPGVYGAQAVGTFRADAVRCYAVHHDPMENPPQDA